MVRWDRNASETRSQINFPFLSSTRWIEKTVSAQGDFVLSSSSIHGLKAGGNLGSALPRMITPFERVKISFPHLLYHLSKELNDKESLEKSYNALTISR